MNAISKRAMLHIFDLFLMLFAENCTTISGKDEVFSLTTQNPVMTTFSANIIFIIELHFFKKKCFYIVHKKFNVLPVTLSRKLPRFIVISGTSVKRAVYSHFLVYSQNFTWHEASTKIKYFIFRHIFTLRFPFLGLQKVACYPVEKHVCNKIFQRCVLLHVYALIF